MTSESNLQAQVQLDAAQTGAAWLLRNNSGALRDDGTYRGIALREVSSQ